MCKCTPAIRTPYCGKGQCVWPVSKPEGARSSAPQYVEEFIAENACCTPIRDECGDTHYETDTIDVADLRAWMTGHVRVPVEPTDAMLVAARDWSLEKYGKPIGNDAAQGCWEAMLSASKESS